MASRTRIGLLLAVALALAPARPAEAQLSLLPPIAPSAMLGMHSISSDVFTSILFVNTLSYDVNVHWLDFDGLEVFYNSLGASESFEQGTYVTHPWLVRRASDSEALVGFLPIREAAQANIVDARALVAPEPASLALLLTGLLGVGAAARGRRRREEEAA